MPCKIREMTDFVLVMYDTFFSMYYFYQGALLTFLKLIQPTTLANANSLVRLKYCWEFWLGKRPSNPSLFDNPFVMVDNASTGQFI